MTDKKPRKLWYIRRKKDVRGPFPAAAIAQYLILGRLQQSDEVSMDKLTWQCIVDVPELTPEVMTRDQNDPKNRSDLEAAQLGADERAGGERREKLKQSADDRRRAERRAEETAHMMEHRQDRASRKLEAREKSDQTQTRIMAIVLLLVCGGLGSLFYIYEPDVDIAEADCTAPPAPHVNWSRCNFKGDLFDEVDISHGIVNNADLTNSRFYRATLVAVDFSYTDLSLANLRLSNMSGANLLGSTLRNTDLRGVNFTGADLSYADLSGARINNALIGGAKLNKTIWPDGRTCAVGSVGECL